MKSEFIIFQKLLIGASVHSEQGGCLWKEDFLRGHNGTDQKKQQVGL